MNEISRVLNFNGQFLLISYALTEERETLLTKVYPFLFFLREIITKAQFNWDVRYEEIKCKEQSEFNNKKILYICTKVFLI